MHKNGSNGSDIQSNVDMNPPVVVHVEDEQIDTVKAFCVDLGLTYAFAKTYLEAASIIAQARGKSQDVLGLFDLNTKGKYQVDGDKITEAIKASTMKGVTKTPIVIYTGDPESARQKKKRVLTRFGEDAGILEVVCKTETTRLIMFLTALKKRVLAEVASIMAPFGVREVNVDEEKDEKKRKEQKEKIAKEINKEIAKITKILESEQDKAGIIAALEEHRTSSTSPQESPSRKGDLMAGA